MQNFKFIKFIRAWLWLVELYKSCSIKQILFNYKRNQSENDYIPQQPENLRFAPIIISYKIWHMPVVQNLKFSGFILYPLSFFLYSPFNKKEGVRKEAATGWFVKSPVIFYLLFFLSFYFICTGLPVMEEISKTTIRNSNCLFLNIYDSLQLLNHLISS